MLAAIGVVAGLAGSAALTRYLESLLFGVTRVDAPTFAAVSILFLVVALLVSYVPAWRATRVDSIAAIRSE